MATFPSSWLLCPVAFLLIAGAALPLGARSPNVLLVMTDDQGWGDLSSHAAALQEKLSLETPRLDRFFAEAASFDTFYVSPVCAPTRAALLTGRYPLRTGVHGVTRARETMRASEVTLAETLRDAGYATGCFGKWHNGRNWPHDARGQGFDEFVGFSRGHFNEYHDAVLQHNGEPHPFEGFITGAITDAAIDFIEQNAAEPFFCYVAYNAPHSPFQAPDRLYDKYVAAGCDPQLASIYGMVEDIDEHFARLLTALDERGLADETIVWFLTDNGPSTFRFNGGMRGKKGGVDEGGVRVPSAVRWPGRIVGGVVHEGVTAHVDVTPTLLGLVGVERTAGPPLDGADLAERLRSGDTAGDPDRLHFSHQAVGRKAASPSPGAVRGEGHVAVNRRSGWELYDLTADPAQEQNLAKSKPRLMQRLATAYDDWFAEVSREAWSVPPTEAGHAEQRAVVLPAHEAAIDGESPAFEFERGWANDWLTDWSAGATATWNVRVVREGAYEVAVEYAAQGPGATFRVTAAGESATLSGVEFFAGPLRPTRDRAPRIAAPDREWRIVSVGRLRLPAGQTTLRLSVDPGDAEVDIKSVRLISPRRGTKSHEETGLRPAH